ncbi:MAG: hypothetical protein AB7P04_06480 [Bacteriovoracia bacterium]
MKLRRFGKHACGVLALALISCLSAPAMDDPTLSEIMGAMGSRLKGIQQHVADPAQNELTASFAEELLKLVNQSVVLVPSSLDRASKDYAANLHRYRKLSIQLQQIVNDLHLALLENRNEDAAKLVQDIIAARKVGHGDFRK